MSRIRSKMTRVILTSRLNHNSIQTILRLPSDVEFQFHEKKKLIFFFREIEIVKPNEVVASIVAIKEAASCAMIMRADIYLKKIESIYCQSCF